MKEEGKCGELREGSPDLGKKRDEAGRRRKRDLGRLNGSQTDRTESALEDKGQAVAPAQSMALWPDTLAIPHALGRLEPAFILCGEGLKGL